MPTGYIKYFFYKIFNTCFLRRADVVGAAVCHAGLHHLLYRLRRVGDVAKRAHVVRSKNRKRFHLARHAPDNLRYHVLIARARPVKVVRTHDRYAEIICPAVIDKKEFADELLPAVRPARVVRVGDDERYLLLRRDRHNSEVKTALLCGAPHAVSHKKTSYR